MLSWRTPDAPEAKAVISNMDNLCPVIAPRKLQKSLLVVLMVMSSSIANADPEEAVRIESAYPFSETLARLHSTLESKGLRVFATIDHRAAAESVGLDMPPTTVLIYGNPKGGTPLMLAAPDFALELPLRVLVREGPQGKTYVTYNPSTALEGKHELPAGMAAKLAPPEALIVDAIALPSGKN
jgi:uncharacterized protein (DUF302 family)